jgi:hypothetical protein
MRDVSPGWANYYAGLYSLWLWLPLWLRWVLGLVVAVYVAWDSLT